MVDSGKPRPACPAVGVFHVKLDTLHSFVLICVGNLPPDVLVDDAPSTIIPLFTNSLAIGPHLKGSALLVSDRAPMELLKHLAGIVPGQVHPLPGSGPSLAE